MLLSHGLIADGQLVRHCNVLTRLLVVRVAKITASGGVNLASTREVKRALPAMTYGGRASLRLH